jgi:hypothetical protein
MMAAAPPLYVLTTDTQALVCRVRVNDVTVYLNRDGRQEFAVDKVNPVVWSGRNQISVSIAMPAPKPGESPPPKPPKPSLHVRLQVGVQGIDPGKTGILAEYTWTAGPTPPGAGPPTEVWRAEFTAGELPWRVRWAANEPVRVDREALTLAVRSYVDAYRARDAARVIALDSVKDDETARALDLDPAEMREERAETYRNLMAAEGYRVDAVSLNSLEFETEGGGRLVHVTGPGGSPAITISAGGGRRPIEFTFAWLDGAWRVVR